MRVLDIRGGREKRNKATVMLNGCPRSYVVRTVKSKAHIPQNNAFVLGNNTEKT